MKRALAVSFWASALGAAWVLVGYPAAMAARRPRPWRRTEALPTVSIIVPAYREREALAAKLRALRELDYPAELIQVIVAVDEDRELETVARAAHPEAQVLFSPERRGKAAGLNRALDVARGEVVVLTDANNILEPGTLRAAVRHFGDPEVWAVAGRRGETESGYARYEDLVRRLETRSGSVAALSGELIVVRGERLGRFPAGVINDDFWLLCDIVRRGGRVVYEPAAGSTEPALDPRLELDRRARIGAGRVALLPAVRRLPPGFALRVASHKLGRLALAPMLLATLVSALGMMRSGRVYRLAAALQLCMYAPGLLALARVPVPNAARPVCGASREVLVGCAGTAIGLVRGLAGRQSAIWNPVR